MFTYPAEFPKSEYVYFLKRQDILRGEGEITENVEIA